jgi:hypothetical protein
MNEEKHLLANEFRGAKIGGKIPVRRMASVSLHGLDREAPEISVDIVAIAHAEGWLKPLVPIERVRLRPWQQAVFWALRLYIGFMLMIMAWGFFHVAGR